MLSSRSDQPQTSHDWLTGDDNLLQPIFEASTGSPQPNKSTHDAPHVDPNKAERAAMVAALMSSLRRGPVIGVDSAKNPVRKSTVASWERGPPNVEPARQPEIPPASTTNLTNFGIALPGIARKMNRDGSPVDRRSNTMSRLSQNGPPPPSLPPMHTQQQRGKPPSRAKRTAPPLSTGSRSPVEPLLPPPAQSTFWDAQTGANSSESEDGLEDVQSSIAQNMRWREMDRKIQSGSGNLGAPTMHPEQRSHSAEPSRTSAENAHTRAVHLFPPAGTVEWRHSPSSGSGLERDTDAPRPQVPQKRSLGSNGQPTYLRDSPLDSLSIPCLSTDSRAPLNRLRRGSISDMLSRFEALSSITSGYTSFNENRPTSRKPKPVIPTKPAALRSPMRKSIAPPPGNASTVSPIDSSVLQQDQAKINSSVKMRASVLLLAPTESPTETSQTHSSVSREQVSPATSQGPLQSLQLPIMVTGRSVSPGSQTGSASDMHEHILLVSPQPRKRPDAFNNHPDPTLVQATTPTISQPSSLEQPFKGVGRLIEQWQKKTEEAERKGRVGVKPTGPQRLRRPPVKLTAAS